MMMTPVSKLKANPSNPRVLRDDKFLKLRRSIEEFPDMLNKRPIVAVTDADGKYMVLGGNMRLRACQDLKMKEVPVILADEWTEEQRREFIIKDNVGFGEWDWDTLANEWDGEQLADWGMELPVGFGAETNEGLTDPDEVPEPPVEPVTAPGDVWVLGNHRLVCGDSTDVASWDAMRCSPTNSFVFTSPPYGVGANARIRDHYVPGADDRKSLYATHDDAPDEWPDLMNAWMGMATTHTGAVICNVQMLANNKRNLLLWMAEHADQFVDMAIWDKGYGAPQMQDNVLTNNHELLLIYSANGNTSRSIPFADFHGTKGTTVSVGKEQNEFAGVHRAVMPVALAEWAIDLMCKAEQVVDPFGGTGTTMMAAERKGKRSALVEMDPAYVDVAVKRWQDFTGKKAIHEASGKTFDELAEAQPTKA